ncbi:hypothetical protein ACSBR2_020220 [Camellia fascicularis]
MAWNLYYCRCFGYDNQEFSDPSDKSILLEGNISQLTKLTFLISELIVILKPRLELQIIFFSKRTFVAPIERLKLEYMVRGEQKNLFELIKAIAATQGLKGFWKGNFVNILRTAPFKAANFYAYDTYRNQLLRMSGHEETTNFERFLAGATVGITATVLCIPMDTIKMKMVAHGGEALGGVIGAFRYMIQNEGCFSLYKGLVPLNYKHGTFGCYFLRCL